MVCCDWKKHERKMEGRWVGQWRIKTSASSNTAFAAPTANVYSMDIFIYIYKFISMESKSQMKPVTTLSPSTLDNNHSLYYHYYYFIFFSLPQIIFNSSLFLSLLKRLKRKQNKKYNNFFFFYKQSNHS